jgi:YggT family protein
MPAGEQRGRTVSLWLLQFIGLLFQGLSLAIVARALLSWFSLSPDNPAVRVLNEITEPILAPLRRVIPRLGMMDITPIVGILLLNALHRLLVGLVLHGPT